MITLEKSTFFLLIYLLIVLLGHYLFTIFIALRSKMDKETRRKFKHICKLEFRHPIDQEKLLITEFVKEYEKKHEINWEKVLY